MAELTTRTAPPAPVLVEPGTITPGRARGTPTAAARGAGQADRRGQVRRRPRRPGCLVRRHDPVDRRACPVRRARPRPGLRLVGRRRRHRRRHSRREHRQLDQGRPADPGPDRRRDPAPRGAAWPHRRSGPCDAAGGAPRRTDPDTRPLPPVFDPLESDHVFAAYEIAAGDPDAAFAAADLVLEGEYRVGHQEQLYIENNAMIAVPEDDGGVDGRPARCSARTTSTRRSSAGSASTTGRRTGGPGGDRRRVRRQGGVPVDDRPPRGAPRRQGPADRCG